MPITIDWEIYSVICGKIEMKTLEVRTLTEVLALFEMIADTFKM